MTLLIIKLILGLALILIGANFLVDGSSSIARKYGISEFVVGMTIVGIGTSTPEMVVSFIASIQGNSDIAVGNIIGSNIANVFLILGVVALFSPIVFTKANIRRDIPLCLAASALLFFFGSDMLIFHRDQNIISRPEGIIFLLCFAGFMIYSFKGPKDTTSDQPSGDNLKVKKMWLSILFVAGGLAGLIFGGQLFVNSGSAIASHLGVPDAFVGITVMAVGTSLPELAASLVAAIKKRGQMALGNIIGSNVSNIFLILGGSAVIKPLTMTNITMMDLSVLLLTSVLVFISAFTFKKKTLDRWEGSIFLICYIAYIWYLTYNL